YAVNAVSEFQGQRSGAVSAFALDAASGELSLLNQQPSGGAGPCHVTLDAAGRHVLVANYGGGSVASLPVERDGRLGPPSSTIQHAGSSVNPQRQEGPHAHSINLDPANRFAFAADLGLDQVLVYRFDAARGTLSPNDPPFAPVTPGAGPRHFAFHPSGGSRVIRRSGASQLQHRPIGGVDDCRQPEYGQCPVLPHRPAERRADAHRPDARSAEPHLLQVRGGLMAAGWDGPITAGPSI